MKVLVPIFLATVALIFSGANRASEEDLRGLVFAAAKAGDSERLSDISGRIDNLDIRDETSFSPLIYAVHSGDLAAVKILLRKGASVDFASDENATPLFWSISRMQAEIILGHAPGAIARPQFFEIAKLLLYNGADPNYWILEGRAATTVFAHLVALLTHNRIGSDGYMLARVMLEEGANPNLYNPHGYPISHLRSALNSKNERAIRFLVCAKSLPFEKETGISIKNESAGFYAVVDKRGKTSKTYVIDCRRS